jgi:hypothetical protein
MRRMTITTACDMLGALAINHFTVPAKTYSAFTCRRRLDDALAQNSRCLTFHVSTSIILFYSIRATLGWAALSCFENLLISLLVGI